MTRIGKTIAGFTLIVLGIAMIALPGPGVLTIAAGLTILASEFEWAQRALDRMKHAGSRAVDWFRRRSTEK